MGVEHRGRVLLQRHCRWAVQSAGETLARQKSSSVPEMARAFPACQFLPLKRQGRSQCAVIALLIRLCSGLGC